MKIKSIFTTVVSKVKSFIANLRKKFPKSKAEALDLVSKLRKDPVVVDTAIVIGSLIFLTSSTTVTSSSLIVTFIGGLGLEMISVFIAYTMLYAAARLLVRLAFMIKQNNKYPLQKV